MFRREKGMHKILRALRKFSAEKCTERCRMMADVLSNNRFIDLCLKVIQLAMILLGY